jgi:hypothetical protein
LRKLFAFDPSLAQALGPKGIASSGLPSHIDQTGTRIAQLVEEANELFSATEGRDLFKATNKTAAALTILRTAIADVGGYGSLIKDLYFLFWEGSGARLDPKPEVFKHINLLRTGLEHDVDHGKAADVKKKKKLIGETFKKYSGGSTPGSLAQELFPVLQSNLLDAVETTLDSIVEDLDSE